MRQYFVLNGCSVLLAAAAMYALTGEFRSACLSSNDHEACIYGREPVGVPITLLDSTLFVSTTAVCALFCAHRSVRATPATWRAWRMAQRATRTYGHKSS